MTTYNQDCEDHAEEMFELERQERRDAIKHPVFVRRRFFTGAKVYDQDGNEVLLETLCDAANEYFELKRREALGAGKEPP